MELNFVQSSEVFGKNTLAWETEFEATGDFNLHVERNKGGDILVYQRTAGSGYAIVEEFRGMDNKPAIDLDFTSVVYPKFVKIVSESQPTYATVTTDGEITEIKSQSKEVEVTANGTMDITPDAGFAYLNSVKVKTNVPTSGEGGGSASTMEYWDISNLVALERDFILMSSYAVKGVARGSKGVFTAMQYELVGGSQEDVEAVVIAPSLALVAGGTHETVEQSFITAGIDTTSIPRITEEQFYTL